MLSARTRSSKFTIVCSTILQHRQKPSPLPDRDHRPSKRNNGRPAGFSRASADRATGVSSTTYRSAPQSRRDFARVRVCLVTWNELPRVRQRGTNGRRNVRPEIHVVLDDRRRPRNRARTLGRALPPPPPPPPQGSASPMPTTSYAERTTATHSKRLEGGIGRCRWGNSGKRWNPAGSRCSVGARPHDDEFTRTIIIIIKEETREKKRRVSASSHT